jgi:hypothetical protein
VLFLAHFDWKVIKNGFRFGVSEMLGSMAWGLGQARRDLDHTGKTDQLRRDLGQLGPGAELQLLRQRACHPLLDIRPAAVEEARPLTAEKLSLAPGEALG